MQKEESTPIDLYAILEVAADASVDEIRRSYFRLAMRYHPDMLDGRDKDSVERFLAIQQAYKELTDPTRRDAYDQARRRGRPVDAPTTAASDAGERPAGTRRPTSEQERDARRAFLHAQELVESGDAPRALGVMKAVIKAVPDNPSYQSLYGYVLALAGQRLHTARDLCRRAVEAEPFNPDFHAQLGYVYLKAGLRKTADGCFQEALRWDPKHALAAKHAHDATESPGGWLRGWMRKRA